MSDPTSVATKDFLPDRLAKGVSEFGRMLTSSTAGALAQVI